MRYTPERWRRLVGVIALVATGLVFVTTRFNYGDSDFAIFYLAGTRLAHGISPYESISGAAWLRCAYTCALQHGFFSAPILAQLFSLISRMPYGVAYGVWSLVNVGMLLGGAWCLRRIMPQLQAWGWWLYLLVVVNPISVWGIMLGQFDALVFLGIMVTWLALERQRGFLAGLAAVSGVVLPQIALGAIFMFCCTYKGQRRLLVLGGLVGTLVLGCFELLTMRSYLFSFWASDQFFMRHVLPYELDLPSIVGLVVYLPQAVPDFRIWFYAILGVGFLAEGGWYYLSRQQLGIPVGRQRIVLGGLGFWLWLTPFEHTNDMIWFLPLLFWVGVQAPGFTSRVSGWLLAILTPFLLTLTLQPTVVNEAWFTLSMVLTMAGWTLVVMRSYPHEKVGRELANGMVAIPNPTSP